MEIRAEWVKKGENNLNKKDGMRSYESTYIFILGYRKKVCKKT